MTSPAGKPVVKKEPKKASETAAVPLPKIEPVYHYDPSGRRDPFKSLLVGREVNPVNEEVAIVNELQKYDLNSLKLVGIIWNQTGRLNRAVIETPDGKGYSVEEGTPIGKGDSRIQKITPTGIVIHQRYRTLRGEIENREVDLMLKKKEEG